MHRQGKRGRHQESQKNLVVSPFAMGSQVPPIRDPTIEAHQVERAKRDDDEDDDLQGRPGGIQGVFPFVLKEDLRALGDAVLAASTVQTCVEFPPAFICCVTWLVTVLTVTFRCSVWDNIFGFPFLAGSLRDVEGTVPNCTYM
ncbi:hypothetical protein Taro_012645 [Colocasia esculenta]|uniref:Uncharacterized protein n=1 Tax=Colocasia esculenta TaxID=4460 RepID=A0A843UGA5_COLES|nr:hypothetical protein [Colocasia esculenta]